MRMKVWMACALLATLIPSAASSAAAAVRESSLDFDDLGLAKPTLLRGLESQLVLPFGVRLDEIVTGARLNLRFSYSPALVPELSHLQVLLNKIVVATVPLPRQTKAGEAFQAIELDPRYFSDFNQLTLRLIGHYGNECEDAMHSSLWASISNQSSLDLSLRSLDLNDDLALLPAPFFDRRDSRRLILPFVFDGKPSIEILNAAGVTASWFGAQAAYRGAQFPVLMNKLPERHAVVFATNAHKPQGLGLVDVQRPTIALVPHPNDRSVKLLVLQGQDEAQLRMASDALVMGQALLSGRSTTVASVEPGTRRPAYDAPNWVPSNRPVKFGELVGDVAQLERLGHIPDPIRVDLRLPPDLLTWNRYGVPIDLKFRHTPLVEQDNSSLSVHINDSFVQAYRLRAGGHAAAGNRLIVPLIGGGDVQQSDRFILPAFKLGSDNQLQFVFVIDYHKQGQCKDTLNDALHTAIDPDSTIDLSDFPHYTAMPNLTLFASAGFPFTKYADLAETAIVIPANYQREDVEQMLFLLGRMGRMTGVAASRFLLVDDTAVSKVADRDLLLLGGHAGDALSQWQKSLPVVVQQSRRSFAPGPRLERWTSEFMGDEPRRPVASAWNVAFDGDGPLAAFMGFQSPLQKGRSVIAIAAASAEDRAQATQALADEGLVRGIRGDVTLIRERDVGAYQIAETYYVGELHWWVRIWIVLSRHPVLVSALGLVAALTLALWLYGYLQRAAARRLATEDA